MSSRMPKSAKRYQRFRNKNFSALKSLTCQEFPPPQAPSTTALTPDHYLSRHLISAARTCARFCPQHWLLRHIEYWYVLFESSSSSSHTNLAVPLYWAGLSPGSFSHFSWRTGEGTPSLLVVFINWEWWTSKNKDDSNLLGKIMPFYMSNEKPIKQALSNSWKAMKSNCELLIFFPRLALAEQCPWTSVMLITEKQ